jgi:CTD small phosphatase-like protein 2
LTRSVFPFTYKTLSPTHTLSTRSAPEVNLVLDLDETLVHCCVDPIPDADLTFPVNFNGQNYTVYVRKRPHLDKFFALIAGKFEVTVFTASQQVYAERLLNLLDPEGKHIHHRLYRDTCLNVDGNFLKDLSVLGRDLSKTVLVDNSPHAFGYQLDNGVPIESWFDDKNDTELLKVSESVLP